MGDISARDLPHAGPAYKLGGPGPAGWLARLVARLFTSYGRWSHG